MEKRWVWEQLNNKLFKVISNKEKGIIKVYDGKALLQTWKDLKPEIIEMIEVNFLNVVATELGEKQKEKDLGDLLSYIR